MGLVFTFRCLKYCPAILNARKPCIYNNFMTAFINIGGESIPDNPLDDLNGVNGTGPLYSR